MLLFRVSKSDDLGGREEEGRAWEEGERGKMGLICNTINNKKDLKKNNAFPTKEKGGIALFLATSLLPLKHKFYSDELLWKLRLLLAAVIF